MSVCVHTRLSLYQAAEEKPTGFPERWQSRLFHFIFLVDSFFLYSSINLSMLTIEKFYNLWSLLEIKSYNSDVYVSDAGIWGALTRK